MALESHSRQALGEEVGGLVLARYFEELDLMRSCQLAHPVYACVYVFGALVHTRALDEKDARITVRLREMKTGISEASKRVSIFSFATQGGKQVSFYFRQRNWVQVREAQIRFPAG